MDRSDWLQEMRKKTELIYDHLSPLYWVKFGTQSDKTHCEFLEKFLGTVPPHSSILSAGCGAGRYDGMLLEAGHHVVGIDQSEGMLNRARERFPDIRYEKKGMQELDFQDEFEGIICIDALEHVFPEDWSVIVRGFKVALKPGGMLYFTADEREADELEEAYQNARVKGLLVVYGEVADQVDELQEKLTAMPEGKVLDNELMDRAVYHFCPSAEQVRAWLDQEKLVIEAEGLGDWYRHYLVRKS